MVLSESESDTESKSRTSSSKAVKDTNLVETDVTDEDEDQFEEETQKEPEVNRLNSYTNCCHILATKIKQGLIIDPEYVKPTKISTLMSNKK